jgi:hypothetical protein
VDVFRKMAPPWFQTGNSLVENDKMPTTEAHTEDSFFCKRLREELGIYPHVDTGILCIHKDVVTKERYFLDPSTNLPSWIATDGSTQAVLPADHPLCTVKDLTTKEVPE